MERDSKRFETMNERLDVAGATCVQPVLMSALDVTSEECPSVQYILLDPPCSGSGENCVTAGVACDIFISPF